MLGPYDALAIIAVSVLVAGLVLLKVITERSSREIEFDPAKPRAEECWLRLPYTGASVRCLSIRNWRKKNEPQESWSKRAVGFQAFTPDGSKITEVTLFYADMLNIGTKGDILLEIDQPAIREWEENNPGMRATIQWFVAETGVAELRPS